MAVPAFLASSFRYKETLGITDVATIITDFRSETVTLGSPVWTEPSANLFKSPVDADGRFMDILLTSISATNLEVRLRDQNAVVLYTRRIQIDGAGTTVRYFTGQFHAFIESVRATPEIAWGAILDHSPESQVSTAIHVVGTAFRTTADLDDNGGDTVGESFSIENGVTATRNRLYRVDLTHGGTQAELISAGGAYLFYPATTLISPTALVRFGGRLYQVYVVSDDFGNGAEFDVPIDTSTTGTFKVIGHEPLNNVKWAIRRT